MKISDIFTYDFTPGNLFKIPSQPVNVMLDVTYSCNNKCAFCYNPQGLSEKYDIDKLLKIIILLGETGTKEILYLGGEPFSNEHINDILNLGKKHNIFQRAVSNGSYFKNIEYCKKIYSDGLNEVGISFHSSNYKIHDNLSGRNGSFEDAINGLENCLASGIPVFVQYSPNTFNDKNDIIILAELIKSKFGKDVNLFDINRLLPIGYGKNTENIILNNDEWFKFLVTATQLLDNHYDVRVELSPFCWITSMANKHKISSDITSKIFKINRGCFMWIAQLALDINGCIKFCPAGGKVGPSILDVEWPAFWNNWDSFKEYRNFEWNDKCISFQKKSACKYFYKCLGGCKYSKGGPYEPDILRTV